MFFDMPQVCKRIAWGTYLCESAGFRTEAGRNGAEGYALPGCELRGGAGFCGGEGGGGKLRREREREEEEEEGEEEEEEEEKEEGADVEKRARASKKRCHCKNLSGLRVSKGKSSGPRFSHYKWRQTCS